MQPRRTLLTLLLAALPLACHSGGAGTEADAGMAADAAAETVDAADLVDGRSAPPDAAIEPDDLPLLEGLTPLTDTNPDPQIVEVELRAQPGQAELVPGTTTDVLTFNGLTPGPLLRAHVGDRVIVHFTNDLGEATTIHWHGLRISSDMDGTPRVQTPVRPGETFTYDFVVPDAGTFWYHPHMDTLRQIEQGLYGMIVVSEAEPPQFTRERAFVLDDVRLDPDGQIASFSHPGSHDFEDHHDLVHGREGDTLLVNGSSNPWTAPVPRGSIERWRFLDAATARTMRLKIEGATHRIIGTDGGLIPEPYAVESFQLPTGQRYDLEITFDGEPGSVVRVLSTLSVFVAGAGWQDMDVAIAEFTVEGEVTQTPPVYPAVTLPSTTPESPLTHEIVLDSMLTDDDVLLFTINGFAGEDVPMLEYDQNVPVVLTIDNYVGVHHPFHLHGQFFQVLSRNGAPTQEPGLKDTVLLEGGEWVEVLTYFENPGDWMYHCHIPEHSEAGMMGHLMVHAAEDGTEGGEHHDP